MALPAPAAPVAARRASASSRPVSSAAPANFDAWVAATHDPDTLRLGVDGFVYADLYDPARLAALTTVFHDHLRQRDAGAYDQLMALTAGDGHLATPEATSEALVAVAPHVSAFLTHLFRVDAAVDALRRRTVADDPLWVFKREFCKKRVLKGNPSGTWSAESARLVAEAALVAAGVNRSLLGGGDEAEELAVAAAVLRLVDLDDTVRKLAKGGGAVWHEEAASLVASLVAAFAPLAVDAVRAAVAVADDEHHAHAGALAAVALDALAAYIFLRHGDPQDPAHHWASLHEPRKLDYAQLVPLRRPHSDLPELFVGQTEHRRERAGFALTDRRPSTRRIQEEVDYCLYCHERSKDSCAKGYRDSKTGAVKKNPLGVPLDGCPLEEKISEMHLLRKRGDVLGALALVCIDNPLCPGTGHRICNDCRKACVFQKQEPVDIPAIETATLTDVLALPWGFEIYGLLTRWNPLNVCQPHPAPLLHRRALVVGLGPAGYTLAHHLARAGFQVAGIDGLKLEPLPAALIGDETHAPRPVKDFHELSQELDERIVLGFGGVSEYGITARWDKNFLTVLYVTLARNQRIRFYGGIRFGGTMDLDDAWRLGFDHVALAAGAGRPTFIQMKNDLARGVRKASDFLMALQLTGAYKHSSLANLQIRLPAIVVGGGLTAIDTATELLAYYVVQAEKTAAHYRALTAVQGAETIDAQFDAEELAFVREQCAHADAIGAERDEAEAQGRPPALQALLAQWGGVSLVYRKTLLDSPAYRLNHEEVEKSLEEGVRYLENLSPVASEVDEAGAIQAVVFERQAAGENGWKGTGEQVTLPARTLCIAAGTSPNVAYEREYPGAFLLDPRGQFFRTHTAERQPDGTVTLVESDNRQHAFFTNYVRGDKTVSFYGDNHPYYAGSVVKAMASAKVGFEKVAALYRENKPLENSDAETNGAHAGPENESADFFRRLNDEWIATVSEVNRLTPTIVEIVLRAPAAARKFEPGQFYRMQNYESTSPVVRGTRLAMEGLALTGAWVDKEKGLLSTIVLEMGTSSRLCALLQPGQPVVLMGPTGTPTEIPARETVLLCGGGLGNAVLFSIARAFKEKGSTVLYFAGYKDGGDLFRQADIEASTDQVIWCTDQGTPVEPRRPQDAHFRGNIVEALVAFATGKLGQPVADLRTVRRVIAIGSDRMMAAVKDARHGVLAPFLDPQHVGIGSINSPMQCMMKEICAQCLQKHRDPLTGREYVVFSCSNQDQELDRVDFQHLRQRLRINSAQEKLSNLYLTTLLAERPDLRHV